MHSQKNLIGTKKDANINLEKKISKIAVATYCMPFGAWLLGAFLVRTFQKLNKFC